MKWTAKGRPDPGVPREADVSLSNPTGLFDPLNQPYGATPVDEEAREHLLPAHQGVSTLAELNVLEADNISQGLLWLRAEGLSEPDDLLDQYNLREIHRQMLGGVWDWADSLRRLEMTIGIDPHHIQEQWKIALDDAAWHIENRTYGPAEITLRLHHRTVQIHPFVNGNGRHARLMADELAEALGLGTAALTWGRHLGQDAETLRAEYLAGLRRLDMNRSDVQGLLDFALNPRVRDEWLD